MTPQAFILIGRSGCGKGTQGMLLSEYLKKIDSSREVLYVQSGNEFRMFINGTSITQKLSKEVYVKGGLQPEFLAIYMWVNILVQQYKGNEHLIIDGTPRKYHEAGVLHSIFDFYKFGKPIIVHISVSKDWSVEHLMRRKRLDDGRKEIEERLSWYETDVVPTIEFYRENPHYTFYEINGEQTIEKVHDDLRKAIKI